MTIKESLFLLSLALVHSVGALSFHQTSTRRDVLAAPSGFAALGLTAFSPRKAVAAVNAVVRGNTVKLATGDDFPLASFGLQVYDDDTARKLTKVALEAGYRNFFASVLAANQKGFAAGVKESKVPRGELFICGSVVSNRARGFDEAYAATTKGWEANMAAFGDAVGPLDQIMLDYPGRDAESIRGQWRSFEDMHKKGLVKTLAVSNFSPAQLDVILNDPETTVKPVVNQLPFSVAYHPGSIEENKKRGVLVQAWAPLGYSLGGKFTPAMKSKCAEIGAKYGGKTFAQVALRWIVQKGGAYTCQTKNVKQERKTTTTKTCLCVWPRSHCRPCCCGCHHYRRLVCVCVCVFHLFSFSSSLSFYFLLRV